MSKEKSLIMYFLILVFICHDAYSLPQAFVPGCSHEACYDPTAILPTTIEEGGSHHTKPKDDVVLKKISQEITSSRFRSKVKLDSPDI